MVEIFTVTGGGASASRSVGNEVSLNAPAKVYFGAAAPGIAYYEKSGGDLKVTLLDGQEVLIRNFFIIGNAGDYSSLLDGGAGGSVEVTGLIAPEPYVGTAVAISATEATGDADVAPPVQAPVQPQSVAAPVATAASNNEVLIAVDPTLREGAAETTAVAGDAVEVAAAGGGAGGAGMFGDFGMDRLLFAMAYVPAMFTLARNNNSDDDQPAEVPTPVTDTDPAAEAPADGEEGGDLPEEVIAVLTGDAAADQGLDFAPAALGDASAFAELGDNMLFDQGRDALSAWLDDFNALAQAV